MPTPWKFVLKTSDQVAKPLSAIDNKTRGRVALYAETLNNLQQDRQKFEDDLASFTVSEMELRQALQKAKERKAVLKRRLSDYARVQQWVQVRRILTQCHKSFQMVLAELCDQHALIHDQHNQLASLCMSDDTHDVSLPSMSMSVDEDGTQTQITNVTRKHSYVAEPRRQLKRPRRAKAASAASTKLENFTDDA